MTSLYQRFKQANLIDKEEYTYGPFRRRAKAIGYMWEAKMTTYLKDGKQVMFKFWQHFFDDNGNDWTPSKDELDNAWRSEFIQIEDEFLDATWHTIYTNDGIFSSKKGFFGFSDGDEYKNIVKKKIEDGSWKYDKDIEKIV